MCLVPGALDTGDKGSSQGSSQASQQMDVHTAIIVMASPWLLVRWGRRPPQPHLASWIWASIPDKDDAAAGLACTHRLASPWSGRGSAAPWGCGPWRCRGAVLLAGSLGGGECCRGDMLTLCCELGVLSHVHRRWELSTWPGGAS